MRRYNGRYIAIHGEQVVGDYGDEVTAVRETAKAYPMGTFLVQKAEPGPGNYTETFHSRVVFSQA